MKVDPPAVGTKSGGGVGNHRTATYSILAVESGVPVVTIPSQ
jgi:hypothetical protein